MYLLLQRPLGVRWLSVSVLQHDDEELREGDHGGGDEREDEKREGAKEAEIGQNELNFIDRFSVQ